MKNKFKFIFCILGFLVVLVNNTIFANDNNFVKRIVSVVYDDSWSMNDNKMDYKYANYALQNIIGFMNENDELHVVRMSKKTQYEDIDLSSKENKMQEIDKIYKLTTWANDTPFEAVETAVECLQDKKDKYGSADNIEYWLLVLTDGEFEGVPQDVKSYLESVQEYMSDVKFESIFVYMGQKAYSPLKTITEEMPNVTAISSSNTDDICRALFDASEKIYGRTTLKENDFKKNGNDIEFEFPFPIDKLIIYEQDQDVELLSIETENGMNYMSDTIYTTNKPIDKAMVDDIILSSKIIEVKNKNSFIPNGKIIMHFNGDVDISNIKFQVMVDTAIALDLGLVDKSGIPMTNEDIATITTEDMVNLSVKTINPYDNSLIDISNYVNNSEAKYQYDDNIDILTYDFASKDYKFYTNLHVGQNNFSASLETKGYFKIKSNVLPITISPIVKPKAIEPNLYPNEVSVKGAYNKNYEKVSTLNFDLNNLLNKTSGTIEFSDIPKGIQVSVNGMTVRKNKATVNLNEKNEIVISRNKDYNENEPKNIMVNVVLKDKNLELKDKGNMFQIIPILREPKLEVKELISDFSNLNSSNAYDKNLYEITPMIYNESITKKELSDSKIKFETNGDKVKFKYKIKEDKNNNTNSLLVSMRGPLLSFSDKNVNTTLTITTPYGETLTKQITFVIYNNIIKTILTILIPLLLFIYMLGMIVKPRFDTKYHKIMMKKNGSVVYDEPINSQFSIIPFAPTKGSSCGLTLKADSNKRKIYVLKNSLKETMTYDGDEVDLRKDLGVYEETKLDDKIGRDIFTYMYYDVRNVSEEDDKKSSSSGRRRR